MSMFHCSILICVIIIYKLLKETKHIDIMIQKIKQTSKIAESSNASKNIHT